MKVSNIVAQVREYLDEVDALNDMEELNGSAPVDARIKSMIPECALIYMLAQPMSGTLEVDAEGVGHYPVPADWGRLGELKLSCWRRPVYDTIAVGSAKYERQQHLVTRGGTVRPVVAIVPKGESRELELYSIPVYDATVTVEEATYVPRVVIASEEDDLSIPAERESAMCYMIATRVARSYGKERAVTMLSASLEEELQRIM
ncbi:MAG: hypothetical protein IJE18_07170 [Bacteroidaceae bacterium]|nr:hypothetical protein [Bacteroidaceae bacterium]